MGTEWLAVAPATTMFCVYNYVRAAKLGGIRAELRPDRMAVGVTCYVAEIVGTVVPIFGYVAGLYIVVFALIINFAILISGAWLLLVAVQKDTSHH